MDIYFYGLTSFRIKGKRTSLIIDPLSKDTTGLRSEKVDADAIILSSVNSAYVDSTIVNNARVTIQGPGEYEVGGVSIIGSKLDQTTAYNIKIDGVHILHLGKLSKMPNEADIEELTGSDIVMVPVGGKDALSGQTAAALVAKLEPRVVIPMYFNQEKLLFEIDSVQNFLKELGKEETQPQVKLTITKDKLPQELEVVLLQ